MPASEVFHKWGQGKLHSGSKTGPVIPKTKAGQKRAEAIYFSEKENEDETGSPDRKKPKRKRR